MQERDENLAVLNEGGNSSLLNPNGPFRNGRDHGRGKSPVSRENHLDSVRDDVDLKEDRDSTSVTVSTSIGPGSPDESTQSASTTQSALSPKTVPRPSAAMVMSAQEDLHDEESHRSGSLVQHSSVVQNPDSSSSSSDDDSMSNTSGLRRRIVQGGSPVHGRESVRRFQSGGSQSSTARPVRDYAGSLLNSTNSDDLSAYIADPGNTYGNGSHTALLDHSSSCFGLTSIRDGVLTVGDRVYDAFFRSEARSAANRKQHLDNDEHLLENVDSAKSPSIFGDEKYDDEFHRSGMQDSWNNDDLHSNFLYNEVSGFHEKTKAEYGDWICSYIPHKVNRSCGYLPHYVVRWLVECAYERDRVKLGYSSISDQRTILTQFSF